MMIKLEKSARDVLKNIYRQFESASEISVSAPEHKKTVIDFLVNHGLLEKLDASTLSGWAYIVRPTYEGETAVSEIAKLNSSKIEEYIKQGEIIMQEEYHSVAESGIIMPDYISGPKSNQWFSEISIFNSRNLKDHPLHDQIEAVCKTHNRSFSAHEEMMGYLHALLADDELDAGDEPEGIVTRTAIVKERNNRAGDSVKESRGKP